MSAIAECHRVDEAKDYRDRAEALRAYARQANNRDAEVQFAEIKVRAERKCGELLVELERNGQRATGKGRPNKRDNVSRLSDLGINPKQSERFQEAARAPAEQVEAAFREARETQIPVTSAQIRAMTRAPKPTEDQREEHERLWRVLRALEQIAAQDIEPEEWLASLPAYMRKSAEAHLSKARPWLTRLFSLWERKLDAGKPEGAR
jgi:hypothetical protein